MPTIEMLLAQRIGGLTVENAKLAVLADTLKAQLETAGAEMEALKKELAELKAKLDEPGLPIEKANGDARTH